MHEKVRTKWSATSHPSPFYFRSIRLQFFLQIKKHTYFGSSIAEALCINIWPYLLLNVGVILLDEEIS
jgi:hypothetical protein